MAKSKPKRHNKDPPTKHFPSKPYMRALRNHSPTATIPPAAWSTTDDELLLTSKTSGKKWVDISPLFPGKTSNACRKRHARLVTNAQLEWNEEREKDLAMEFVNAKVGFFKALAANLGLEWQQVEKKCIEMGFKTLLEKGKKCSTGGSTSGGGTTVGGGARVATSPPAPLETRTATPSSPGGAELDGGKPTVAGPSGDAVLRGGGDEQGGVGDDASGRGVDSKDV